MIRKSSFFVKIFLCLTAVIATATIVPAYYFSADMEESQLKTIEAQAFDKLQILSMNFEFNTAQILTAEQESKLEPVLKEQDLRLSVIRKDGIVIYDSGLNSKNVAEMDNHNDRPEFIKAIETGKGSSVRYSNTLKTDFIYVAKLQPNKDVIRLAFPYTNYIKQNEENYKNILQIFLIGLVISLLLALFFSYRIKHKLKEMVSVVESISLGKYDSRLHHVPGQEFAALADAVNRMAHNIERQLGIVRYQSLQLQVILNTMQDGVLLLDTQGNVRHSNKAIRELAPRLPESDRIPSTMKIPVIECVASPLLQNSVDQMLKQNGSDTNNIQHLDIELFPGRHFVLSLAKPENPSENMGLVIVLHEISDIVRLETIRRDFVANVSHELRTPLTAIQGYAETIENMAELPEDCRRFAQIIHKHGSYLNTMIEDLLSLARIENPNESFVLSQVLAAEALSTAANFCNKALQHQHLKLKIDMDSKLLVQADKIQLERVFRNLLENACRYANTGSQINVYSKIHGNMCSFTVENTGSYIAPEHIERIFERFYRVEKDRNNSNNNGTGPSTGLGLAICKHIIERHGGNIKVQSTMVDGYGVTAFTFTLFLADKPLELPADKEDNNE